MPFRKAPRHHDASVISLRDPAVLARLAEKHVERAFLDQAVGHFFRERAVNASPARSQESPEDEPLGQEKRKAVPAHRSVRHLESLDHGVHGSVLSGAPSALTTDLMQGACQGNGRALPWGSQVPKEGCRCRSAEPPSGTTLPAEDEGPIEGSGGRICASCTAA